MPRINSLKYDEICIFKYILDYFILYKSPLAIASRELETKTIAALKKLETRGLILSTECDTTVIQYKPHGLKHLDYDRWTWCGGKCKGKK